MNLTREYTKEALDPSNYVISLPNVITMFIPTLETLLTKILNPQISTTIVEQINMVLVENGGYRSTLSLFTFLRDP